MSYCGPGTLAAPRVPLTSAWHTWGKSGRCFRESWEHGAGAAGISTDAFLPTLVHSHESPKAFAERSLFCLGTSHSTRAEARSCQGPFLSVTSTTSVFWLDN